MTRSFVRDGSALGLNSQEQSRTANPSQQGVIMAFTKEQKKLWGAKRGWKCERCTRSFRQGNLLEFHHRIPSSLGGPDTEENAVLLCIPCHLNAHKQIEIGARISAQLIQERLNRTKGRWK